MIYIIYAISIIFGVIFTMLINRKEEREKEEIQTKPWIASEYLSRIEKASVEILSQKKPVDQIIVLWWGLDGLRMNEDGSLEWISRKKPEKQPEQQLVNQNVFHQPQQSIGIEQSKIPFNYSMCQSTRAQIDELQEKLDALQEKLDALQEKLDALQEKLDACKMQNTIHSVNAQVVAQMQLPIQMVYPYGYIQFPQYPYAQRYQGNLTGCCCDGNILH